MTNDGHSLPPVQRRTGSVDLFRARKRAPLRRGIGVVIYFVLWGAVRTIFATVDLWTPASLSHGARDLLFALFLVAGLLSFFSRRHYRLIFDRSGHATLLAKRYWSRVANKHIIWVFDTNLVRVNDEHPWWRAPTLRVDDLHYVIVQPSQTLPRIRQILADPTGPAPPPIRASVGRS